MKRIIIETIPHEQHRKEAGKTVGDYHEDEVNIYIRVSRLSDWRYEFLIIIHELVEKVLCNFAGVSDKEIDNFDFEYVGDDEPGNDLAAPYHLQHKCADIVERFMAIMLNVDWGEYEKELEKLD